MNLNKLRDKAYQCAVAHGWHEENLSDEHFLCLVISELMEAVEADRKGKHAKVAMFKEWQGNSIPLTEETRISRFVEEFEAFIKGTVEEELSDACIRLLDLAGLRGISLASVPFPFHHRKEYKEERSKLTFTEWVYDVIRPIVRYNKDNYPIGYLFIGVLQELFCKAEIMGFDLLWHIEQKMKYNELRPYKHGDKSY
ncbi:MAG TPA: hypothetical protein OIM59_08920 [Bacteroides mediterraneensis]|uniref:hypothetical protein n=1 Tax=Bacteroides mediterraneensis TaxID=1841856 RepID=UPI0026EF45DB|nr:hypothetical protein [Bacteroides mediterraneensis]HJH64733.1 hypothetical protein [Bacteroides mediterraneensis]